MQLSGSDNATTIYQVGQHNWASTFQLDTANSEALFSQNGADSILQMGGSDNVASLTQRGEQHFDLIGQYGTSDSQARIL